MEGRTERADRLYDLAESQEGYFTSADAKSLGYDYPHPLSCQTGELD